MADSHEKEKTKPDKESSTTSRKVLFVRNLPFSTSDNDLENFFSEVGPVKRCFVIRNKGKSEILLACIIVCINARALNFNRITGSWCVL